MNYLIASHGQYSRGLTSVIHQVFGTKKDVHIITAYEDEKTLQEQFDAVLKDSEDSWIIMTDVLGGSVNQFVMTNYCSEQYKVVTGVTASCMLGLLMIEDGNTVDQQIRECLGESKNKMCFVNTLIKEGME